jgi:hypothetical protein
MNLKIALRQIYRDFFTVALITWLLLVLVELLDSGAVQRFINLEYWFYFLILASFVFLFFPHKH